MHTTDEAHLLESTRAGSYREVWRLAYPAMLTMISQTVMWTVDSAMVGHVGKQDLAAVGLGGMMIWTVYSFFIGFTYSVNTFVSQYYGAGKHRECSKNLWQGVYIAIAAGLVLYVVRSFNPSIVGMLRPEEAVRDKTLIYADIRMLSAPFMLIHFTYSNFFRGIGNTRTPMKVIAFANLLNLLGDYLLIFGKGGFPAMGVAGAAWATALSNLAAASIFTVIVLSGRYRRLYGTHATLAPCRREMLRLLRIGIPIAVHFFLDMGSFLVFYAFVARMGTDALAANQIVIQVLAFSFMPCQGFSIAATTLMGQYIGAGSIDKAKRRAYDALRLGMLYSVLLAILYVVLAKPLVLLFNDDPAVLSLGVKLLYLAAVFQFFDALQMIASGALRGAGDTRVPMMLTVSCAYLLFLPLAYIFGIVLDWGVIGAWAGATLYIAILATAIMGRLHRDGWKSVKI